MAGLLARGKICVEPRAPPASWPESSEVVWVRVPVARKGTRRRKSPPRQSKPRIASALQAGRLPGCRRRALVRAAERRPAANPRQMTRPVGPARCDSPFGVLRGPGGFVGSARGNGAGYSPVDGANGETARRRDVARPTLPCGDIGLMHRAACLVGPRSLSANEDPSLVAPSRPRAPIGEQ
jgi:hypothetical protein